MKKMEIPWFKFCSIQEQQHEKNLYVPRELNVFIQPNPENIVEITAIRSLFFCV